MCAQAGKLFADGAANAATCTCHQGDLRVMGFHLGSQTEEESRLGYEKKMEVWIKRDLQL